MSLGVMSQGLFYRFLCSSFRTPQGPITAVIGCGSQPACRHKATPGIAQLQALGGMCALRSIARSVASPSNMPRVSPRAHAVAMNKTVFSTNVASGIYASQLPSITKFLGESHLSSFVLERWAQRHIQKRYAVAPACPPEDDFQEDSKEEA